MAVPQSKSIMGRVKNNLGSGDSGSEAQYSAGDKMRGGTTSDFSSLEAALPSKGNNTGLSLRLVERKGEFVAPKHQITSHEGP